MAVDYIKNCHRMIVWAEKIRLLGYSVYIPCLDFLQGLITGTHQYKDYFDNSQPWLDAADAVFLVPGWENSEGTKKEIARAAQHNIPVFDSMIKLDKYLSEDIK